VKKVRYVIGALGTAPLAAMLMPAGTAVAAPMVLNPTACNPANVNGYKTQHSTNNRFNWDVRYSPTHTCVAYTTGNLGHIQDSLEFRTRVHEAGKSHAYQTLASGFTSTFFPTETLFSTYSIDHNATKSQVCAALVYSYDTNQIAYDGRCIAV
jgi:hypothetical protein